jgi:hypothetical protein
MPLVQTSLANTLKGIFAAMQDGEKSDAWMANQVGAAIADYIGTGIVSTVDDGSAPAGAYAGAGAGTMAIAASTLKNSLKTTFEAKYSNADLAAHIAADIHAVCTADGTVSIDSTGSVAAPTGAVPTTCSGEGAFSGSSSSIQSTLNACFNRMNGMAEEGEGLGGDDHFGTQLAAAVHTYLTGGTISVELQSPISGSGEGSIA